MAKRLQCCLELLIQQLPIPLKSGAVLVFTISSTAWVLVLLQRAGELANSIRVKHIDHVTIVVKDLNRSRDFYVGMLGMEEVPRPAFQFAGLWFQAGATLLHLIEEHDLSGLAGTDRERSGSSRCQHFAFEVADAQDAARLLKEHGLALVDEPKLRPDGAVQMFVEDPDGHLIELCTSSVSEVSA